MKRSEKSVIIVGILILIIAAYFTISLMVQFLGFGIDPKFATVFGLGKILVNVYGFSSVFIPIFLFAAAIMFFMPNFTSKKSVLLGTSILPFFTVVACERLLRKILPDSTEPVFILKLIATLFITVLIIAIEYVAIGIIFDFIVSKANKASENAKNSKNVKKDDEKSSSKISSPSEVVRDVSKIAPNLTASSEMTIEESEKDAAENESVLAGNVDVAENESALAGNVDAAENESVLAGNLDVAASEADSSEVAVASAESYDEADSSDTVDNKPLVSNNIFSEKVAEKNSAPVIEIPTVEDLLSATEFEDDENSVPKEQIENVDLSGFYAEDDAESKFLADPFGEDDSATASEVTASEVATDSNDAKNDEPVSIHFNTEPLEEIEQPKEIYQVKFSEGQKEIARQNYPEFMSEEEKMNKAVPLMDIKLGDEELLAESEKVEKTFYENDGFEVGSEAINFDENEEGDNSSRYLDNTAATVFCPPNPDEEDEDEEDDEPDAFYTADIANPITIDDEEDSDDNEDFSFNTEGMDDNDDNDNVAEDELDENDDEIDIDEDESEFDEAEDNDAEPEIEVPVAETVVKPARKKIGKYEVPAEGLLTTYPDNEYWIIDEETKGKAEKLKEILNQFKIEAEVTGIKKGPVITMFELVPAPGVKLSKIVALSDNIALGLAAPSVRIVAPIPGKSAVGIEIPNKERAIVSFKEIIENDTPAYKKMAIPVVLGKDITGEAQLLDLAKTPHLLIAGATGAGKSVCVNSLILSILFKRSPDEVKLILIDPKVVELKLYNDIPHLLTPVITEPKRAFQSLQYCLCEMERRYSLLDGMGVRDIVSYNRRIVERNIATEKLPYIVVVIDEFADLMATTGKELESTIARLAAMSRAVGIHLVLATQRPSIDVITGLIKANIPTRIAFMVASKMDSRIIIDQVGADKLLGKGDMLYASATDPFPVRIQGTYVSDNEVENVVNYVKQYGEPEYIDEEIFVEDDEDFGGESSLFGDGDDPLYNQALEIVIQAGKASASYLQRRLKIGYNRAARLVEEMEERGIVGPANGAKPRELIHVP